MVSSPPPTIEGQPSVLLAEWQLRAEDAAVLGVRSARRFCIYGAKVPITVGYYDGWRSEYAVQEQRADGLALQHHLAQRAYRERRSTVMWISAEATNTV